MNIDTLYYRSPAALQEVFLNAAGRLWAGFNRRYSEIAQTIRNRLSRAGGPVVVAYRVSVGRLSESNWHKDRRQNGRLPGELCHLADAISRTVAEHQSSVSTFESTGDNGLLQEDLAVSLRYSSGYLASITHADHGHPAATKERLEILRRGHTAVIEDSQVLQIDGGDVKINYRSKDHIVTIREFYNMISENRSIAKHEETSLVTSRTMLEAASTMLSSRPSER